MSMALSSLASQAQPTSHSPDVPDTFLGSILHGNPIFSAGFGLMVMGGALAYGRSALRWGASAAQRRMKFHPKTVRILGFCTGWGHKLPPKR